MKDPTKKRKAPEYNQETVKNNYTREVQKLFLNIDIA
jgi:hypothetical protein